MIHLKNSVLLLMLQKSGEHQLRLVVYLGFMHGTSRVHAFSIPSESKRRFRCSDDDRRFHWEVFFWNSGLPQPMTNRLKLLGITWVVPPPRMPVTTRIITFLVGDPYKPSFATVTGRGDNPRDYIFHR